MTPKYEEMMFDDKYNYAYKFSSLDVKRGENGEVASIMYFLRLPSQTFFLLMKE